MEKKPLSQIMRELISGYADLHGCPEKLNPALTEVVFAFLERQIKESKEPGAYDDTMEDDEWARESS